MLQQHKVLLTGDSRGLGKELHKLYKQKGYAVLGLNRSTCDLSNTESVKSFVKSQENTPFHTVILNAATVGLEYDEDYNNIWSNSCEKVLHINFLNQVRLVQSLLPNIQKNLIFITSRIASFDRYKNQLTYDFSFRKLIYASTKVSLTHITHYYAQTNEHLRVYSIAPGSLQNEFEGKHTVKNKTRIPLEESAKNVLNVIETSTKPSGSFLNYDGEIHVP